MGGGGRICRAIFRAKPQDDDDDDECVYTHTILGVCREREQTVGIESRGRAILVAITVKGEREKEKKVR